MSTLNADGTRVGDAFLTTVDVDFYGAWEPDRGVPTTPQLCRHVEWTRGGRRVVRANQGARPGSGAFPLTVENCASQVTTDEQDHRCDSDAEHGAQCSRDTRAALSHAQTTNGPACPGKWRRHGRHGQPGQAPPR